MEKNGDFTRGIIWGIALTFLGSFLQFYLHYNYQNREEQKDIAISSCRFLENRYQRSNAILQASTSSVFKDRWENYIDEVIYPWNSKLFLIDNAFASQNDPELYLKFDEVCEQFRELHIVLNNIRKKQGVKLKSNKDSLKTLENEAKSHLKQLEVKINFITEKLIN